jgi:hypothetical protein
MSMSRHLLLLPCMYAIEQDVLRKLRPGLKTQPREAVIMYN